MQVCLEPTHGITRMGMSWNWVKPSISSPILAILGFHWIPTWDTSPGHVMKGAAIEIPRAGMANFSISCDVKSTIWQPRFPKRWMTIEWVDPIRSVILLAISHNNPKKMLVHPHIRGQSHCYISPCLFPNLEELPTLWSSSHRTTAPLHMRSAHLEDLLRWFKNWSK